MRTCLAFLLALGLSACESEQKATPVASGSTSAQNEGPNLGGKLAQATVATAKPATADQPPATGIFEEGLADKAFPANAPPKLELLADGADPKLALHAAKFDPTQKMGLKLTLNLKGESILPPLAFFLEIGPPGTVDVEPAKPTEKGAPGAPPKPAPTGSAAAGSAAPVAVPELPPGADRPLVAVIRSVGVAGAAPGETKAELQQLIDMMQGASISFTMTKTGPTKFDRKLGAKIGGNAALLLDLELSAIEDTLSGMYTAAPDKPVGVGAYWMVTDRRMSFGSEVIRYRVFRVVEVEGDTATLSVELRQYATNDKSAFAQPPLVMDEYAAAGKGAILIVPKLYWPAGGLIQMKLGSQLVPAEAKGNPRAQHQQLTIDATVEIGGIEEKPAEKPGAKPKDDKGKGGPTPAPKK